MSRKGIGTIIALFGLAIAVVLGAVAYNSVRAEADPPEGVYFGIERHGRGFGGFSDEDLAEALGITVEELQAARAEAQAAAIAQAVDQGLITQAQADELEARGAAFPFGIHWDGWLAEMGVDYETLFAEALNLSVDELQNAYTQAYTARIDQAVADGNLTEDQADLVKGQYALSNSENFQSAMETAYQNAVQQAVEEGIITQAQADQILAEGSPLKFRGWGGIGVRGGPGFDMHIRHAGPGGLFSESITPPTP